MPPLLRLGAEPTFLLGVNYWSRAGGPRMWERFDAGTVRRELRQMRNIGLNVCRSFAFIPTFMPHPPVLSRRALQRFETFLGLCDKEGMATIPSFLVGHMSGENHDFPGQRGRSPYASREVLAWEKKLTGRLARVGAKHPAVVACLASNEMPFWGGPAEPSIIAAWARGLKTAAREQGLSCPFGLGDGVMNLRGGQNGFDVDALREIVDFLGPHTYATDTDPLRQAYNAEYCLRSLTYLGLPVLFEEFGCSSTQASDENQALYYREVIHACLSAGAAGALGWCYSDFDLAEERPYAHHAFELLFGITRADGSEKPVCDELRRVSAFIDTLAGAGLQHPRPKAAILVPSTFRTTYPFSEEDRGRMRRTLLQSYALCAGAGIEAELVPEGTDLTPYGLVLCPSTQKLVAPTWIALLAHARRGNTVYWSYFGGDHDFHQGAWCPIFEELTGCRHLLRYGCYDLPDEITRLEGADLNLAVSTTVGGPYPRAFLPIEPRTAEVLARDGRDRPALTEVAQGEGRLLFLAYPLEYYLGEQSMTLGESNAFALYRLLARRAGLAPPVTSTDPGVQLRLVGTRGTPLLWVINHRWESTTTAIDSPGGVPVHGAELPLDEGSTSLGLAPKQVAVFRLARSV